MLKKYNLHNISRHIFNMVCVSWIRILYVFKILLYIKLKGVGGIIIPPHLIHCGLQSTVLSSSFFSFFHFFPTFPLFFCLFFFFKITFLFFPTFLFFFFFIYFFSKLSLLILLFKC